MASSYEIQEAIAAVILAAAPTASVKARNILGKLEKGDWEMLRSAETPARIHGWVVTKIAHPLTNSTQLEFSPQYAIWQFMEYRTGDDSGNSEKDFLDEQDAVRTAFAPPLADPISAALPPSFDDMRPAKEGPNGRLIHIARGVVTIEGLNVRCE
jgi:hypothetical protein